MRQKGGSLAMTEEETNGLAQFIGTFLGVLSEKYSDKEIKQMLKRSNLTEMLKIVRKPTDE